MWIRRESLADHDAIHALIEAAFAGQAHAAGTEARIVDGLRRAGALSLSLVADIDGRIAGQVALSPVSLGDGSPHWYGLGPVAVAPADQGHGVGAALVRAALAELRAIDAQGCVVLGDPAYYTRFGFARDPALFYPGAPAEYFLALRFGDQAAGGEVIYHPAFSIR